MSEFPHFRKYKRSNHPALIIGLAKIKKEADGFLYRKTSHSPGVSKKKCDKIDPNPNPNDNRPMYIEKRKRADFKFRFGEKLNWKFPQKK